MSVPVCSRYIILLYMDKVQLNAYVLQRTLPAWIRQDADKPTPMVPTACVFIVGGGLAERRDWCLADGPSG